MRVFVPIVRKSLNPPPPINEIRPPPPKPQAMSRQKGRTAEMITEEQGRAKFTTFCLSKLGRNPDTATPTEIIEAIAHAYVAMEVFKEEEKLKQFIGEQRKSLPWFMKWLCG